MDNEKILKMYMCAGDINAYETVKDSETMNKVREMLEKARQDAEIKERERISEPLTKLITELKNQTRSKNSEIRDYVFPLLNNLQSDLLKIIWRNELKELKSKDD